MDDWYYKRGYRDFSALIGEKLVSVEGCEVDSEGIAFKTESGKVFNMYHDQDCCESVRIVQIDGDVADLVGEVFDAREESGETPADYADFNFDYSYTWTFYVIRTERGTVTIRWLGESNGYYSESVSFKELAP